MHEIVGTIELAWQRSEEAQELLEAAKDADGYRAAVRSFVTAVREAEILVEKGSEELARREAEKEERRRLQEGLDQTQQALVDKQSSKRLQLAFDLGGSGGGSTGAKDIENMLDEIRTLRAESMGDLAAWRTSVEEVVRRAEALSQSIDAHVAQAAKRRREEHQKKLSLFNQSPQTKVQKEDEKPLDPVSCIRDKGLSSHEGPLLEILSTLKKLQANGAQKTSVKRFLEQFTKATWSDTHGPSGASSSGQVTPRTGVLSWPSAGSSAESESPTPKRFGS